MCYTLSTYIIKGVPIMKTYEELVTENQLLKKVNKQLKQQIFQDDLSKYPWFGNLGHWYWNYQENIVDFNPKKAQAIGYEPDEVPLPTGFEFFTDKVHQEDYNNIMDEMRKHLKGEIPVWEVKYRIQAKDGSWRTFYDRGTVTQRSKDGKPLFLSGIIFDITREEKDLIKWKNDSQYWRKEAQFDSLTGLYNRSKFIKRLKKLTEKCTLNHAKYSLVMFDVDFFKIINDTYGHLAGDQLLMYLGKIVGENLREDDFSGRYGGDEFIAVFPNTSKVEVTEIIQKIQFELNQIDHGFKTEITFSAGVVSNDEAEEIIDLFRLVDERLYVAKRQGRNQVVCE